LQEVSHLVKSRVFIAAAVLLVLSFLLVYIHNVPLYPDEYQTPYIKFFENGLEIAGPEDDFDKQLAYIRGLQRNVLEIASHDEGIPRGMDRGPMQLFEMQKGLCFDRSRTIELILRERGFSVRHIFIISLAGKDNLLSALATVNQPSHAISEVFTSRGWMVIGSNSGWTAVTAEGDPVALQDLKAFTDGRKVIEWRYPLPEIYISLAPWRPVYGLYSRHGEFYPPYNPVPDFNIIEFCDNFF
jgi:hypothetical protein